MNYDYERLGQAIDRVDSVACGLVLPLPANMHVTQLKQILPDIVKELKSAFVELAGENPWEDEPSRTEAPR